MSRLRALALLALLAPPLRADGPMDNLPDRVRRVPPPGVQVPEADRDELRKGLAALEQDINGLQRSLQGKPELLALLPDVQVYFKAVHDALRYNEIFDLKDVPVARKHLAAGRERARALAEGKAPWLETLGLVVRGYRSKIDGSVQPYGLVVPREALADRSQPRRLDVWCHGRGETLSELRFIDHPSTMPGEFVRPGAFVLYLYGRFCCANKFAGEVDCFEAMDAVRQHFTIDNDRVVIRGFSMGGAACWQFAVHFPDVWCAAAPGAGFSETQDFLKVFQNEPLEPTWYERKLWHWYDCTDYARNLFNLPTVAYSGEIDKQKQAADIMAKAMHAEGLELTHLIGPKTGHSYHPESRKQINERIDPVVEKGRNPVPKQVKFVTYTLRYNRCFWLTLDGLGRHWERAEVEGTLEPGGKLTLTTKNVTALTVTLPRKALRLEGRKVLEVKVDPSTPAESAFDARLNGNQLVLSIRRGEKKWESADKPEEGLRKRPGLQGPIDDAFLSRFLMVRPTGKSGHESIGKWVEAEMHHAQAHWRQQFRGEAPTKDDTAVTDDDVAESNLVLWGDPASNAVLKKIAEKLPIRWTPDGVQAGTDWVGGGKYVPAFIYPNPLNPKRYVVVNSGFTFREYDYLNNARQVPKLPDFAVLDVSSPPTSREPGKVVTAGFFDEHWQMPKDKQQRPE